MPKITAIAGLEDKYATRLRSAGVRTTEELLDAGATRAGRKQLAETTGVGDKRVLAWVNRADLLRVSGVSAQYAELLEEAGVETVKELRRRNAERLAQAIDDINGRRRKNSVQRVPSAKVVQKWVDQAKELPVVVKR